MKKVFVFIISCLLILGIMPVSGNAKDTKAQTTYDGYSFESLPGFNQFTSDEFSQLYTTGFSTRMFEVSDELCPEGVEQTLKMPISSVGEKIISSSRHLYVKDRFFYDGLQNVGEKTIFGDIKLSDYDGIAFWVGNYTDSLTVILRRSPCGGPYGFEGDDEVREIYQNYGAGVYFRSSNIYPDENGYVFLSHEAFHPGYVWWEQGSYKEEIDSLNSIDIIFNNEKLNMGTAIYIGDFKAYKEPEANRTLDELILLLEKEDADGKYQAKLNEAKAVLESGTQAQYKEMVRELTLILKSTLLKELYVNSYNSMKDRITESGYSPTSVTGFYDGMYVRDSSIQSILHTKQGDTHLSRMILNYILGAYQELGSSFPNHVISELRETAFGNNDGGNPGQYASVIKLGGESFATQTISATKSETIVSVGVWLSRKDGAYGNVVAELKRNGISVGADCIDVGQLSNVKEYVVFDFGLPLTPVKEGNYTLTLSAPQSQSESVIWYGRRNYKGLPTVVDGNTITAEASFDAFKTNISFESTDVQPDTILALAHAWMVYANAAPDTPEDNAFIEESYPVICKYVNAFINNGYINEELKLMKTNYLEHTRDFRKWQAYDLITNTYASQVFYELAQYNEKLGNTEEKVRWLELSEFIRQGIYENLTTEVDGKKIYAEMIAIDEDNKFYQGMSWVNLAPIAVDWYALDTDMMEATLEVYASYAQVDYNGLPMLDACYNMFNGDYADHVIGKGYSWELMFCAETGNTARVDQMIEFMLMNSPSNNMYPESWWYPDMFSDVGNQEHSSWLAYGMATVFPELAESLTSPNWDMDDDGKITVADALIVLKTAAFASDYSPEEHKKADFDSDGFATVADALMVLRKAVGLI